MRLLLGAAVLLAAPLAHANSDISFSASDRSYRVGADRVCQTLPVTQGSATGASSCATKTLAEVAKLNFAKAKASTRNVKATTSGAVLTVSVDDTIVVRWQANEPLGKVQAVATSEYGERIVVSYTMRRAGRDMVDTVGFDFGDKRPVATDPTAAGPGQLPSPPASPAAPTMTPQVKKLLGAAQLAKGKKADPAWRALIAVAPLLGEGYFGAAKAAALRNDRRATLAYLDALKSSAAPDAIEWQIAARFDAAFAKWKQDAQFRAAVGLDQKGSSPYEKIMGGGGAWEQTGTSCDVPTVALNLTQARKFALQVTTTCEGSRYVSKFKGTWSLGQGKLAIALAMPNKGKPDDVFGCEFTQVGDEQAIHCQIDQDLQFSVLPVMR